MVQTTLKVRAAHPVLRFDSEARVEVSKAEFAKDPNRVFEVPNNSFWRMMIMDGDFVLLGEMAVQGEPEPVPEIKDDGLAPLVARAKRGGKK